MIKEQMENVYRNIPADKIPWNMEEPPEILRNIVDTGMVKPCQVLELGCGIGHYVIYLASKGFDATGIDISTTAIQMAMENASQKDANCSFISTDAIGEMPEVTDTFDFIYDYELLHHIFPEDREKYFSNVSRFLNPGGHYLSVCFSEDSLQFGGVGKYRKTPIDTELYFSSESELELLFKQFFEIIDLKTVEIAGKYAPHKAVLGFMRG